MDKKNVETVNLREKNIKNLQTKTWFSSPIQSKLFLILMTTGFDPEAASDIKATLQFEFTGSGEGSCYFIIADGTIKAKEGKSERPNLIIKTPFEVWMDIVTGKADGVEMFMEGKYEAEGNLEFLDMSKFFGI